MSSKKETNTMDNTELIRSNKGGMKLIHMGYMYTVHKRRLSGGIRWRCTQRSLFCKGSVSTGPRDPPKINMAHNHVPDPRAIELARQRQQEEFGDDLISVDEGLLAEKEELKARESTEVVETAENCEENSNNGLNVEGKTDPENSVQKKETQQNTNTNLLIAGQEASSNSANVNVNGNGNHSEEVKSEVPEEVCLRWNSHHTNIKSSFPEMLMREQYVDVTLCTEGKMIKCHKLIISSCSSYFDEILSTISPGQHPVIFLAGISYWAITSLIDFMYYGEIHIQQNRLSEIIQAAQILKIKGLSGKSTETHSEEKSEPINNNNTEKVDPMQIIQPSYEENVSTDSTKRITTKRLLKKRKLSTSADVTTSMDPISSPRIRKGTKSRPIVKAPKYYHNEYETSDYKTTTAAAAAPSLTTPPAKSDTTPTTESPTNRKDTNLMTYFDIKSEPVDSDDDDGNCQKVSGNCQKVSDSCQKLSTGSCQKLTTVNCQKLTTVNCQKLTTGNFGRNKREEFSTEEINLKSNGNEKFNKDDNYKEKS